jgi:hypothetical protein
MFQPWIIFLKGFLTCASLIVAIGAENSFVLRQGILRSHIFLTAITCVICDAFRRKRAREFCRGRGHGIGLLV